MFCCKVCKSSNTDLNFNSNTIDQKERKQNNNGPFSIENKYYNISNSNLIDLNENINNINITNDQIHN